MPPLQQNEKGPTKEKNDESALEVVDDSNLQIEFFSSMKKLWLRK